MLLGVLWPTLASAEPAAWSRSYAAEARGDLPSALSALDGDASDPYLLALRKGWLLYLSGRHTEAITAYQQAIAASHGAIEARLGATLPLMALRRWQDAEKAAGEVLALAPHDKTALTRRAWCLFNLGRYGEAEVAYRQAWTDWPSDPDLGAGVGWSLLRQGKKDAARAVFDRILAFAPDHASANEGQQAATAP